MFPIVPDYCLSLSSTTNTDPFLKWTKHFREKEPFLGQQLTAHFSGQAVGLLAIEMQKNSS